MLKMNCLFTRLVLLSLAGVCGICPVSGAGLKSLHGHVPEPVKKLTPTGNLPATNELRLAIGVPLRDPAGLDKFITELYDPASPNYRRYLTPTEFAARFGPTEGDYAAVKHFALANGLKITGESASRLLLDVSGPVPAVESTFHIKLKKFQHPTEAREFFAPDAEPSVAVDLPVADVQGLSDYVRPHPRLRKSHTQAVAAKTGSAPGGSGSYFGNDFRNAYVPGVTLTGAGQQVGLLQFDGYYANDIAAYAQQAGGERTNIVIQKVLLDGYDGTPTTGSNSGEGEVALDIEMAMAMAPGLAKIVVFEAGPNGLQNDVLNAMAASNTVKNLSCSWGWGGGPSTTSDAIFQQMITQGQSFFNASGDSDAFTVGASSANGVDNTSLANAPSSSPYITQVGGTTLTMNGTGAAFASETVWNWGGGTGSSGGVSSYYSQPSWQTNISMTSSLGSTSQRNIPDVALTADNVYLISGGSAVGAGGTGGTSCAAPLWAGFMALVNQQAALLGNPSAGFINPAVYAIGKGQNPSYSYSACFHDTTSGNNYWTSSPAKYPAVTGYDLCTGWGTPNGASLINALAGSADSLGISPQTGFALSGVFWGPFVPNSGIVQLTNASASALNWSLVNTSAWLVATITNGTLAAHAATNLTVSLTTSANALAVGSYSANLAFTNKNSHVVQTIPISLQIAQPLSVAPVKGFTAVGPVGGPFTPNTQVFVLTNLGTATMNWSLINTSAWLTAAPAGGSLAGGRQTNVTVGLSASANTLPAAVYSANVLFTNPSGIAATVPFTIAVGQPVIQNGGFETGDFTGWTPSGNPAYTSVSSTTTYVHAGSYGAQLGPSGSPGYLAQNLTTVTGQIYLLSLWLRNPAGSTPNQFQVQWNGTTVFYQSNFTATAWTNVQMLVTATGSTTVLQLGFQDDPSYLGLDDVSVTPLANPGFKATSKSTNLFNLTLATTPNLKYQVQYTTNLLKTNWLNLGAPITATTNTLTVTDTNTALSPQRYYRFTVTP